MVRMVGAVDAFSGQEEYLLLDNYFARKRTNIECGKAKGKHCFASCIVLTMHDAYSSFTIHWNKASTLMRRRPLSN